MHKNAVQSHIVILANGVLAKCRRHLCRSIGAGVQKQLTRRLCYVRRIQESISGMGETERFPSNK